MFPLFHTSDFNPAHILTGLSLAKMISNKTCQNCNSGLKFKYMAEIFVVQKEINERNVLKNDV